jgi:chaperonin GroES
MSVKVGDTVLFGPYAGNSTAKIDGEEVLIVSESEIYGVLEAK